MKTWTLSNTKHEHSSTREDKFGLENWHKHFQTLKHEQSLTKQSFNRVINLTKILSTSETTWTHITKEHKQKKLRNIKLN